MAAPAPEAPAAPSYTPIVTDVMRLVRVLYEPSKVFEEQREKPTWFVPWLVIAIVCVLIGYVQLPYTQRVIELALQAFPNAPQLSDAQLRSRAMFGIIVTPIVFLIFAFLGAGILYLIVSVGGSGGRYRGMMSATVFSQVLVPVTLLLQALILRMRGSPADAITAIADAQPALGLNVLLTSDSRFLQTIYAGIGPLPIWSVIIVAIGLMRLEKVKKNTAWGAAIASYVLMLLIGAALSGLQRG
jgi:hypothetical protein